MKLYYFQISCVFIISVQDILQTTRPTKQGFIVALLCGKSDFFFSLHN